MKTAKKTSTLRKLEPQVKMPTAAVLQRFSATDRRLLAQVTSETLECVYHPAFRRKTAEKTFMQPLPELVELPLSPSERSTLASEICAPPRHRILTASEESDLFLRFNYCRHRLMRLLRDNRGKRLGVQTSREVLRWATHTLRTRNYIVRVNTSLVMAMARRTKTMGVELGDLVSEGNLALLRCVDKFDCSRGFKFSTYACRAIMSGFVRLSTKSSRYRTQFPATFDPTFERSDYTEVKREEEADDCVSGLKVILNSNTADLSQVEQRVIHARFALDRVGRREQNGRPRTLEQVGQLLGVSKERVRQIQNRALAKLRSVIEESVLVAS